jgi:hypothetical protein
MKRLGRKGDARNYLSALKKLNGGGGYHRQWLASTILALLDSLVINRESCFHPVLISG